MSVALFKKSLEIVEGKEPSTNKKNKGRHSAFDVMPENHKMLTIVKSKGQKRKYNEFREKTKLSIEDAKQEINSRKDKTDENIKKLLQFSAGSGTMDREVMSKLVRRAKTGHYVIPSTDPADNFEKDSSVFSEKDFEAFEKDYFCSDK